MNAPHFSKLPLPDIVKAEARDRNKVNSVVRDAAGQLDEGAVCYWNGNKYSPGARLCAAEGNSSNLLYICQADGSWLAWGNC